MQHVVGAFQHVAELRLFGRDGEEPVIGDRDQAVHVFPQFSDPLLGGPGALGSFKEERLGHDAHGQRAHLAGGLRHDGGRAGAGAAAHARGHKDHIGVPDGVLDRADAFLSGIAAHVGIGARAEPFGQLLADLELDFSLGAEQGLGVRIGADEGDPFQACHDHVLHGVAAAASDADDLDIRGGGIRFKLHIHHSSSSKKKTRWPPRRQEISENHFFMRDRIELKTFPSLRIRNFCSMPSFSAPKRSRPMAVANLGLFTMSLRPPTLRG